MKNIFFSAIILFGAVLQTSAQTTLAPGDIAFVSIQSGESGQTVKDRFAFILLKDIEATTKINFTDNAVLNSQPVRFCKNEGVSRWTATNALTVGTIVSISEDSVTSSGTAAGGLAFSQSGDQVLAYQTSGADTLMLAGVSITGWETSCASACGGASNNKTCLPAPLENGVNAIGFPTIKKNAYFNLATASGTPAEILAAINNPSNWTQADVLQTWPTWNVSVITSIADRISSKTISLFPTISNGRLEIKNPFETQIQVQIYNLLGKNEEVVSLDAGKNILNLSRLQNGIYFARPLGNVSASDVKRFQIVK